MASNDWQLSAQNDWQLSAQADSNHIGSDAHYVCVVPSIGNL